MAHELLTAAQFDVLLATINTASKTKLRLTLGRLCDRNPSTASDALELLVGEQTEVDRKIAERLAARQQEHEFSDSDMYEDEYDKQDPEEEREEEHIGSRKRPTPDMDYNAAKRLKVHTQGTGVAKC